MIEPTAIGRALDPSPQAFGEPRSSSDAGAAKLRSRLDEDGYLFLPGFLKRETVLEAGRELVDALAVKGWLTGGCTQANDLRRTSGGCYAGPTVHSEEGQAPRVRALFREPRIVDLFARLFGAPVRSYDHIWLRTIAPGQATGPHCDIVYMGRGTKRLLTCWLPLADVAMVEGPLLILEGSHRRTHLHARYLAMDIDRDNNWSRIRLRHWKFFRGGDYSRNPVAVQRQFGGRWLSGSFRAGDLVVMTAQTMHGSLDNVSAALRISADTRFQPADEPVDERWTGQHPIGHGNNKPGA